ncbi:hypothetical protein [Kribbella sp. NPDC004536]|uniref:hypothetical protein n=1 Tax=Kribbella sp. NPDC004536 TaxID=3364106 RepID=UPI00369C83A6
MRSPDRRGDRQEDNKEPRPQEPETWRDVIRSDYKYPDDLDDMDRRSRRRAKKSWRRDDYAQRMAWMRRQRQAEPTSPVAIVVVVLLLAIIVLGFGGGLPKLFGHDQSKSGGVGLLTPSAPAVPATLDTEAPTSSVGTPTVIAPPPLTERPSPAATAAADGSARSWAQVFYTRNPASETYDDLVTKASKFTSSDVSDSLRRAGDSTYTALKASQGTSRVVSIDVKPPKEGTAPVDTPTRITRLATVTIDVTGKQPQRIVLPLLLTLAFDGDAWVVSDIDGGTGP